MSSSIPHLTYNSRFMLLEISVMNHPLCLSKVELTENEGEAEAEQGSSVLDKAQQPLLQ